MSEKSFLTVEEAAKYFGVNPSTVYRLAQRGELPAFKVGGQWRFSQDVLETWVVDQIAVERLRAEDERIPASRRRTKRAT